MSEMQSVGTALLARRIGENRAREILAEVEEAILTASNPAAQIEAQRALLNDVIEKPGKGAALLGRRLGAVQQRALNSRTAMEQLGLRYGQSYTESRLAMTEYSLDWAQKKHGIEPQNLKLEQVSQRASDTLSYRFVVRDAASGRRITFDATQSTDPNPRYAGIFDYTFETVSQKLGRRSLV